MFYRKLSFILGVAVQVVLVAVSIRVVLDPQFSVSELPGGVVSSYIWSLVLSGSALLLLALRIKYGREPELLAPFYLIEAFMVLAYVLTGMVKSFWVYTVGPVPPTIIVSLAATFLLFREYCQLKMESQKEEIRLTRSEVQSIEETLSDSLDRRSE